jgi:hypothetical protein
MGEGGLKKWRISFEPLMAKCVPRAWKNCNPISIRGGLLKAAEELDCFCAQWKRELRNGLLEVHGMAHTVINGAPLSRAPGKESLPEAAYSLGEELREYRESLDAAIALLDQIAGLAPD